MAVAHWLSSSFVDLQIRSHGLFRILPRR